MADSTATDIAPITEATDAEAASFELDPHLINLMWDEPFFSNILRSITKIKTDQIPTAGVICQDNDFKLWWNPKFVAALEALKVKGLLKHEAYHLIFEHTTTRRRDPHTTWNYCTDWAINSLIDKRELPECGLYPGDAFTALTEEQKEKMGPANVERHERMSAFQASLPVGLSAEQYFGLVNDDADAGKDIEDSNKGMSLQDLVDAIKNGDITFDENGNPCDADGNPIPVSPGGSGGEGHDGWDELSDEDREFLKGKMKKVLEDATQKADSTNGWGSVGAETRGAIRELISREVDWKKVLKSAVGNKKRAGRTSNVKRMNRKYPGVHPGTQRDYTSSWAVYVDQSGSVGDDELALAFGELNSLAKRTSFHVHYFDTEVDTDNAFQWRKGQRIQAKRTRCGGTCFKAPTKHANENTATFDGSIIITDGYAPVPGPTRVRRVWVIVPGGELQFPLPKGDVLVKMKWPNQKAA